MIPEKSYDGGWRSAQEVVMTFFLALITLAAADIQAAATSTGACESTPIVQATSPLDPSADPVNGYWYLNEDRSIWVSVPREGWPAGGRVYRGNWIIPGQKTYWVRPRGTALNITGRRLDGDAKPVEADVPCCYTSGFQIVALHFPTEGCWEVHATAGDRQLRFVTKVLPPLASRGQ
jgi:hypothetical protein